MKKQKVNRKDQVKQWMKKHEDALYTACMAAGSLVVGGCLYYLYKKTRPVDKEEVENFINSGRFDGPAGSALYCMNNSHGVSWTDAMDSTEPVKLQDIHKFIDDYVLDYLRETDTDLDKKITGMFVTYDKI